MRVSHVVGFDDVDLTALLARVPGGARTLVDGAGRGEPGKGMIRANGRTDR